MVSEKRSMIDFRQRHGRSRSACVRGMTLVFTFPGQSSRDPEMVRRAFSMAPDVASEVFGEASEVLGRDLVRHYTEGNGVTFTSNRDIQLGVFLVNHVHLRALEAAGISAEVSLGLSLGEYNHLVHIGALAFDDALRLVHERGRLYTEGPAGIMAAIFPIDPDDLSPILAESSALGAIGIAVTGSPTQTVVAGDRAAVERVAERVDQEHWAQCVIIEEHIPMHVPLFAPVAKEFAPVLESAPWRNATLPYLPNVEGHFVAQNGPSTYIDPLLRHVSSPVRWRESIDFLVERLDDPVFVEVGPKKALTNLLSPKWHRVRRYHTDLPDDPAGGFADLVNELGHGSC